MSNYDIPADQKTALRNNKVSEFQSLIAQRELDAVVFTAQGKTDEASAAQAEIDDAKAAIDALIALN